MTKKEFEDRTGYTIPEDRYKEVEQIYYAVGESIDKDTFCKDFKEHSNSEILYALFERTQEFTQSLKRKDSAIYIFKESELRVAKLMLSKAQQHLDDELYCEVIELIGLEAAIILKLEMNLPLRDSERSTLIEVMKQK
ncbi:hypothetical protein [Sangeribacter muris]|uniref:hypothetical protein n=1 Tax=Sangeribacter muris TaxID=2880703 RepID=UPI00244E1126|nr:hypothetical protein [Sangeribacter muris]